MRQGSAGVHGRPLEAEALVFGNDRQRHAFRHGGHDLALVALAVSLERGDGEVVLLARGEPGDGRVARRLLGIEEVPERRGLFADVHAVLVHGFVAVDFGPRNVHAVHARFRFHVFHDGQGGGADREGRAQFGGVAGGVGGEEFRLVLVGLRGGEERLVRAGRRGGEQCDFLHGVRVLLRDREDGRLEAGFALHHDQDLLSFFRLCRVEGDVADGRGVGVEAEEHRFGVVAAVFVLGADEVIALVGAEGDRDGELPVGVGGAGRVDGAADDHDVRELGAGAFDDDRGAVHRGTVDRFRDREHASRGVVVVARHFDRDVAEDRAVVLVLDAERLLAGFLEFEDEREFLLTEVAFLEGVFAEVGERRVGVGRGEHDRAHVVLDHVAVLVDGADRDLGGFHAEGEGRRGVDLEAVDDVEVGDLRVVEPAAVRHAARRDVFVVLGAAHGDIVAAADRGRVDERDAAQEIDGAERDRALLVGADAEVLFAVLVGLVGFGVHFVVAASADERGDAAGERIAVLVAQRDRHARGVFAVVVDAGRPHVDGREHGVDRVGEHVEFSGRFTVDFEFVGTRALRGGTLHRQRRVAVVIRRAAQSHRAAVGRFHLHRDRAVVARAAHQDVEPESRDRVGGKLEHDGREGGRGHDDSRECGEPDEAFCV